MDIILNKESPVLTESNEPKNRKKKSRKDLFSTIAIIIAAPILAFILTVFVFQSYQVEGQSMQNTLQDKDRLIVVKAGKTWSRITHKKYIPKRYNIIVFNYSGGTASGESKQIIKRVIGLPGDRVVIKGGVITIYNSKNPNGFNPDENVPSTSLKEITRGSYDNTIQNGEVFVLGDNRDNSFDSRIIGPVKSSDIVGQLSMRIFPLDNVKRF
jgi:signal peptidase I